MDKRDYLRALAVPVFLKFVQMAAVNMMTLSGRHGGLGYGLSSSIEPYYLVVLLGYGIAFYAGWAIVRGYGGTVSDSVFVGVVYGMLSAALSILNFVLLSAGNPGYASSFSMAGGFGGMSGTVMMLMFFASPTSVLLDTIVATAGGHIATKTRR